MPRIYMDGGYWDHTVIPQHAPVDLELLPADRADALLVMRSGRLALYVPADRVAHFEVTSNGATFFSHQPGTAALAGWVDRFLAGWSAHVQMVNGDYLAWTAVSGPPPGGQILAAMQALVARSTAGFRPPRQAAFRFDDHLLALGHDRDAEFLAYPHMEDYFDEFRSSLAEFPEGQHAYVMNGPYEDCLFGALAVAREAARVWDTAVHAVGRGYDNAVLDEAAWELEPFEVLLLDASDKTLDKGTDDSSSFEQLLDAADDRKFLVVAVGTEHYEVPLLPVMRGMHALSSFDESEL